MFKHLLWFIKLNKIGPRTYYLLPEPLLFEKTAKKCKNSVENRFFIFGINTKKKRILKMKLVERLIMNKTVKRHHSIYK